MRAPEFWSRDDLAARLAVAALSPIGWIYGAVTQWKHRHSLPHRARAKVVCVGNLTAGGSGKTPVVIAIARRFQARGRHTFVLTRGYGGRLSEAAFVDTAVHCAADIGDEPMLLGRVAPVIVSRDRKAGAALADAHGADVIVMDDGHQNFALEKDLAIVVVDAEKGFGNGHILPAGPLREAVADGLARADAVVLVGAGEPALPGFSGPVIRARLVAQGGDVLAGRRVVAFAGIGRPEKFFATLRGLGAQVVEAVSFADHHVFSASEMARLHAKAKKEQAMLVTTEKDFFRLTPSERDAVHVLPIEAVFEPAQALDGLIDAMLAAKDLA